MIKDEKCNTSIDEYPLINVTFYDTFDHCDCSYSNVSKRKRFSWCFWKKI